jgi:pyrroloquinoline quinone (PQQ) biosynthesis protein C
MIIDILREHWVRRMAEETAIINRETSHLERWLKQAEERGENLEEAYQEWLLD